MNLAIPNYLKLLFLICLTIITTLMVRKFLQTFQSDTAFLINLGIAIAGIFFAAYQTLIGVSSIRETRNINIKVEQDKRFDDFKEFYLLELAEINQKVADQTNLIDCINKQLTNLLIQFSTHKESMGHQTGIQEIIKINDKVADLNAALTILTKEGEITLKIDKIQKKLIELDGKTSLISASIPS